jgi:hypothetical protein
MTPFPDAAYPPPEWAGDDKVTVRLDYDDAVYLYELLAREEMPVHAQRAPKWAQLIFDAIDKFERG